MLNYHKIWRLINSDPSPASYNMALDESIAIHVRKDASPPTLRLYSWDMPSLSLGCFQKASDIDMQYCTLNNIPVVRRLTGGRAILHNDELTYSFSAKTNAGRFSAGLFHSYETISNALNLALQKLGINAGIKKKRERGSVLSRSPLCFQSSSFGEILAGNRKIIGSAQKRWTDGLLQQGSIPYMIDIPEIHKIFRLSSEQKIKETMAGLKEMIPDIDDKKFRELIKTSFEESFDITLIPGCPSQDEEALARHLETDKYQKTD